MFTEEEKKAVRAKIEQIAKVLRIKCVKYKIEETDRCAVLTIDGQQTEIPWDLFDPINPLRKNSAGAKVEELLKRYNRT